MKSFSIICLFAIASLCDAQGLNLGGTSSSVFSLLGVNNKKPDKEKKKQNKPLDDILKVNTTLLGTNLNTGLDSLLNNQAPSDGSDKSSESSKDRQEICEASRTVVRGGSTVCQGALIFNEDFNENSLEDLQNWVAENKFPEEPDYPFNVYMSDSTLALRRGNIHISPVLLEKHYGDGFLNEALNLDARCTGQVGTSECKREAAGSQILPPVMTGKITTRNKFSFKFGRIEIRAKLPAGNWLLPEINLEPQENVYGSRHYESGLMRIAFAKGNAVFAKKLYGGPVLSDTEPYRSELMKEKVGSDNWNKDYHNYSMVWTPESILLYVDGEQYGTVNPGDGFYTSAKQQNVQHAAQWLPGTVMAPLDQFFFVSLGLRVGGINDFADGPDKPWKNRSVKAVLNFWKDRDNWLPTWYNADMKVDYVKVYAL